MAKFTLNSLYNSSFPQAFFCLSSTMADNGIGAKEIRRSRIWTKRSVVFCTVL